MAATNTNSIGMPGSVTSVNTTDLVPATPTGLANSPVSPIEDPDGIDRPEPRGISEEAVERSEAGQNTDPLTGSGVEGEVNIWEARYSNRNFIARIAFRSVMTLVWIALAVYTWNYNHESLATATWIALGVVMILWLGLILRMIQAHYSHYYRLTNRRLFVSTGIVNRRRDMMELLRVKDVFTRQDSLIGRWLGLGTVVVVPSEKELPTFYLAGVDDPKEVMDLIWHHARAERDHRSIKVDQV